MALPKSLMSARMTNATTASLIDNAVGDLEKALADIFGIPIDTLINTGDTVNFPFQPRLQNSFYLSWGTGNNGITGISGASTYLGFKVGNNADALRVHSNALVMAGDVDTFLWHPAEDTLGITTGNVLRVTVDNTGLNVLSGNIEIVTNGAIWWTGDDDTFISHPAANTIRFTAGGADVLTLDAAGMIINQSSIVLGGDIDTFLGHPGENLLTLVCGNVEVARAHSTLGLLLGTGMALRWGADTNTYILNTAEDVITVQTGGADRVSVNNAGLSVLSGNVAITNGSLFWAGDGDTFVHHPAADSVGFNVGGAERVRIQSGALEPVVFKEPTLNHGYTAVTATTNFGTIGVITPGAPNEGGVKIHGYASTSMAAMLVGACVTPQSTDTGASVGIVNLDAYAQSANNVTSPGATANILTVRSGGSTRMLLKGNGEVHASDTTWAELLDTYDDVHLVRAFSLAHGPDLKGLIRSKWDDFVTYNRETLIEAGIVARDGDDGSKGLVNLTQLWKLHNGAIWQLHTMIQEERECRLNRGLKTRLGRLFFKMRSWLTSTSRNAANTPSLWSGR